MGYKQLKMQCMQKQQQQQQQKNTLKTNQQHIYNARLKGSDD